MLLASSPSLGDWEVVLRLAVAAGLAAAVDGGEPLDHRRDHERRLVASCAEARA